MRPILLFLYEDPAFPFSLFFILVSHFFFLPKKRPILVFQYEDPASPPPGVGLVGSQVIALMGWVLNNEKV